MFTIYAFGALLILLAGTLIVSHWRSWRRVRDDAALSEVERRFAWRQCRRRTQASAMIGIVGLAMSIYQLVPPDEVLVTVYLGGLLVVVLWIMLLAIGDVIETKSHFGRIRREQRSAQARLAAELENHREATR
jgi:putative copper export protein